MTRIESDIVASPFRFPAPPVAGLPAQRWMRVMRFILPGGDGSGVRRETRSAAFEAARELLRLRGKA